MKALFIYILTFFTMHVFASQPDSLHTKSIENKIPFHLVSIKKPAPKFKKNAEKSDFKTFTIGADWLLETKAELVNGISYSPTLEFNLNHPGGFNFQIQTGALPVIQGFHLQKTQPAAGFSVRYRF